ncbi:unnamed protein product [Pieris brassicae]|uniref:Uncharacterized protein n=1 Tax=Pieris brassicae TaxID=7116 RepID=A0A9P0SG61_PIEBR|nr:unnamed protein product [Pieris brassicae]
MPVKALRFASAARKLLNQNENKRLSAPANCTDTRGGKEHLADAAARRGSHAQLPHCACVNAHMRTYVLHNTFICLAVHDVEEQYAESVTRAHKPLKRPTIDVFQSPTKP